MPYNDPAKGVAESLPGMRLIQRAGEGGDVILQLLQRYLGQGKTPDALQKQRGNMSEAEYRQWLAQQGQLGQQMVGQEPSTPAVGGTK